LVDVCDGAPEIANACVDFDEYRCDVWIVAAKPIAGNDGTDVEGDGLCDFGDPDDDNDGQSDWADCAMLDPTLRAAPAEVSGLRLGSGGVKHRVSWTAPQIQGGSATVSDVVRGSIGSFPVGSGVETCLSNNTASSQHDDATPAGADTGYWYLVRAANACGVGSYGRATGGAERVTSACP
jgi:hypothetical protein